MTITDSRLSKVERLINDLYSDVMKLSEFERYKRLRDGARLLAKRKAVKTAGLLLLFLIPTFAYADKPCRDPQSGMFVRCELLEPDVVPEPEPTPAPTPQPQKEQRLRMRAMAGGLTALATDTKASVKPLASLGIEAPLSTSDRGPSLEVQVDLTALPGETLSFADPKNFHAIEASAGLSQPLHPALLFRAYVDVGAASRLATSEDPVSRLPAWWSIGLLFRTESREHFLKLGIGSDQRLSGEWAATVHVSGQVKVGEKGGVSMYLVGSLIRALDLSAYGYATPARDSLRVGLSVGI